MNWLLLWLHLVALATWLGETIFFSAIVAPAVFGGLERQQAGAVISLLFPGYYAVGYACGAVLVLTGTWLWRRTQPGGGVWLLAAVIATAMLACCLIAGLYVLPEADALRPLLHDGAAAASVQPRFDALHALAVQLNGGVLAGALILAGLLAARLRAGIVPPRRLSRYGERVL